MDIMVKPEQRIQEVYQRLLKAGFFSKGLAGGQLKVYSMRRRAYVNPLLTFGEGRICAGDIIKLL